MISPVFPLYFAISCVLTFVGTFGNIALIGFCLRRVKYYKMTNIEFFMTSLACFNLIKIGLFLAIAQAAYYAADWVHGSLFCAVISKAGAVTYLMTEFVLIFLTHVNYKVIVTSQLYIDTPRKFACYAFTAAFMVVCGVIAIPGFYEWKVASYDLRGTNGTISKCSTQNISSCEVRVCEVDLSISYAVYMLIAILVIMFLPTFYFIVALVRLRRTLKISLEKLRGNTNIMYYRIRLKENNRLLSILAVTCFGFTLSYVPVTVLHFYHYKKLRQSVDEQFRELYSWYTFVLFVLTAVDTCSTPFAYLVVHPSFRRMMYKALCFSCRTRVLKRRKTLVIAKGNPVFTIESSS